MTPVDQHLDPAPLFQAKSLRLYRLARTRYANLSGVGAAAAPGRWNLLGEEAIYTSTELGVPVLERLVHTPKSMIPSNLALMRITLQGDWEQTNETGVRDPRTDGRFVACTSVHRASLLFHKSRPSLRAEMDAFAVAVPSVIVPAWNVVLFPQSAGFWDHVSLESIESFDFDPRLFPDEAAVEL